MNPILVVDDNEANRGYFVAIHQKKADVTGGENRRGGARPVERGRAVADSAGYHAAGDRRAGEVCRRIRRVSSVPILMITAKDEDADRILGLDIGADDYIVKPFSPGEVMARIRGAARRIPAAEEKETLVVGDLLIHLPSLSVALSGHKLNLTRREVELLYTLASAPGRVFTRDDGLGV